LPSTAPTSLPARAGCSAVCTPTATSCPGSATTRDAAARLEQAVGAVSYVATECRSELDTYCANVEAGEGLVAQCLKNHASDLSPGCDQALTTVGVK
jgi:hypothetical protein